MKKNSTDSAPITLHLSRILIVVLVVFFFGIPIAGYWVTYHFIAPRLFETDIAQLKIAKADLTKKYETANLERNALKTEKEFLLKTLEEERLQRAGSEARATIAETAKITSSQQVATVEEELTMLRRTVKSYEELLKPSTKQDILQCFNIRANYAKGKTNYGVSFLKNSSKNRKRMAIKVQLRILQGGRVTDLDISKFSPLSTRSFSFTKDYRLGGTLVKKIDKNILHILDIRAFDSHNKQVAQCWKAIK